MMQLGTLPGLPIRPGIPAIPTVFSGIPDVLHRASTLITVIPDVFYRESILVFFGWIPDY